MTRRQVQNESWAAEGDRKVVSREGHGSSGPLLQTAAHEWPSFCMTLLLNTNASFFFFPLRKTEQCHIRQSQDSNREGCNVGHESPASLRTPHRDASGRPALCQGRDISGSLWVRCPTPDTSTRAKRTVLRSTLQAVHMVINGWVSFCS